MAIIINSNSPVNASNWLEKFARFGLTAKGVVYALVGTLAIMAAFHLGGKTTAGADKQGVFGFILSQPFGKFLLGLVALGLACYTIWRLMQAFMDTENKGKQTKGVGKRIGYAFSGLVYGFLAVYAAKMAIGDNSGGGGGNRQTLARQVLDLPFGQMLLGAVALGTIGLGIYQIYRALSGKYRKKVQETGLKPDLQKTMIRAGYVGYIARGIVWMLMGYLLLKAAMNSNAQQAGGTDKALTLVQEGTFGTILLAAMGLGLVCYGVFMFVRARYETIKT